MSPRTPTTAPAPVTDPTAAPQKTQQEIETETTAFYYDRRGGDFIVVDGVRVHSSELPLTHPASTAPTDPVAVVDVPVATPSTPSE